MSPQGSLVKNPIKISLHFFTVKIYNTNCSFGVRIKVMVLSKSFQHKKRKCRKQTEEKTICTMYSYYNLLCNKQYVVKCV